MSQEHLEKFEKIPLLTEVSEQCHNFIHEMLGVSF